MDQPEESGPELAAQARVARGAGQLREAADLYGKAAEIAGREGDLAARAHRLRHLGEIRLELGEREPAAMALDEALAIYRSLPAVAPLDLANMLRPLAMLREAQGAVADAREAWAEAQGLYIEAGIAAGASESEARLKALAA